jgi:serine/threonine-protein kinase RsbW
MKTFTETYTDLDRAIDEVRTLADKWTASRQSGVPDDKMIHYACLVLHEWIANLHQHAHFRDDPPTVKVRLSYEDCHIFCSVSDNSEGFEMDTHLPTEDDDLESLPERGMGLRIIKSCTDDFSYAPAEDGLYRFEFIIPSDHDPWLNTLF